MTQPHKYLSPLQRIAAAIYIIAILFGIQHWPYASWIMVAAIASIPISTLISFLQKKQWGPLNYLKLVLSIILGGYLFIKHFHLPGRSYLLYAAVGVCMLWFAVDGIPTARRYSERFRSEELSGKSKVLFAVPWVLCFAGIFRKVFNYSFADLLIIAGSGLAALLVFTNHFQEESDGDEKGKGKAER